jgi:hypothetical protein
MRADAIAPASPGTAANLAFGIVGLTDSVVNRWLKDPDREPAEQLVGFITDAVCGIVEATARANGASIDMGARLDLQL